MRLLRLSPVLLTLLIGVPVEAQKRRLPDVSFDIYLSSEASHQPGYLCIVSFGEPSLAHKSLQKPSGTHNALPVVAKGMPADTPSPYPHIWVFSEESRGNGETGASVSKDDEEIDSALRLLAGKGDDTASLFDGVCNPAVEPFSWYDSQRDKTAKMTCVKSSANTRMHGEADNRRVAVVQVLAYRNRLGGLSFNGEKATLTYTNSSIEDYMPVTARVLGGDYMALPPEMRSGGRIDLDLVPRCYTRRIESPKKWIVPPENGSDDGEVECALVRDSGEAIPCPKRAMETELIQLPYQPHGEKSELRLSISTGDGKAVYAMHWETTAPPKHLIFRPTAVYFGWRLSRNFPILPLSDGACPTASIPAVGLTCSRPRYVKEGGERGTCFYNCASSNERPEGFEYPQTIRFTVNDLEDTWEETLSNVGQVFSRYADSATRHLFVDFENGAWCGAPAGETPCDTSRIDRYGDRIKSVKLEIPDGRSYRIVARPDQTHRIVLSGAGHGDLITYCIEGDRQYYCRDTHIRHGRVPLGSPDDAAKLFSLSLNIGGGFVLPFTFKDGVLRAKPYGNAQISFRFQPIFEPPMALEISATYVISEMPYRPISTPNSASVSDSRSVGYNRFMLSLSGVVYTNGRFRFAFSPGLGLGFGYPLLDRDVEKVGNAYLFWVLTEANLRYALNRKRTVFLEINSRVLGFENLFTYTVDDTQFTRSPKREREHLFSLHLGCGLRGWLW